MPVLKTLWWWKVLARRVCGVLEVAAWPWRFMGGIVSIRCSAVAIVRELWTSRISSVFMKQDTITACTTRLSSLSWCVLFQMILMIDIQICPLRRVSKECNSYKGNGKDHLSVWKQECSGNNVFKHRFWMTEHCLILHMFSKVQLIFDDKEGSTSEEYLLPYYLILFPYFVLILEMRRVRV